MDKLQAAIDKILNDQERDPWTDLCVATVELGAAFAKFQNAKARYVKSEKDKNATDQGS